jgi:hypothetical protein
MKNRADAYTPVRQLVSTMVLNNYDILISNLYRQNKVGSNRIWLSKSVFTHSTKQNVERFLIYFVFLGGNMMDPTQNFK